MIVSRICVCLAVSSVVAAAVFCSRADESECVVTDFQKDEAEHADIFLLQTDVSHYSKKIKGSTGQVLDGAFQPLRLSPAQQQDWQYFAIPAQGLELGETDNASAKVTPPADNASAKVTPPADTASAKVTFPGLDLGTDNATTAPPIELNTTTTPENFTIVAPAGVNTTNATHLVSRREQIEHAALESVDDATGSSVNDTTPDVPLAAALAPPPSPPQQSSLEGAPPEVSTTLPPLTTTTTTAGATSTTTPSPPYSNETNTTGPNLQVVPNQTADQLQALNASRAQAQLDCGVTDWNEWSNCAHVASTAVNNGLVGGIRTRFRVIITPQSPGGAACPDVEEKQECVGVDGSVPKSVDTLNKVDNNTLF